MSTVADYLYGTIDRELTVQDVVDEARDESCPIHHRLEWDDAKASDLYRCEQVRGLYRSLRIVYAPNRGPKRSVPELVSIPNTLDEPRSKNRYVRAVDLTEDQRAMLLIRMEREFKAFKARYQHMKEFLELLEREIAA